MKKAPQMLKSLHTYKVQFRSLSPMRGRKRIGVTLAHSTLFLGNLNLSPMEWKEGEGKEEQEVW
ncbi:MAG: hypothetical protein ACFFBD_24210 [Candidatus Hodarchaeota archaeon]